MKIRMSYFEKIIRRFFLWLALGPDTYRYVKGSVFSDHRAKSAHIIDLVVRKDAKETRIEADWVKSLIRIMSPYKSRKI